MLRATVLVGHLEVQQVGELIDVVAIAHAVVAEDVAVVPELPDEGSVFISLLPSAPAAVTKVSGSPVRD